MTLEEALGARHSVRASMKQPLTEVVVKVSEDIDAAIEHFGATLIDIEAQEYAKGFYESIGFKQSSESFMLDGIPHIKMSWSKQDYM